MHYRLRNIGSWLRGIVLRLRGVIRRLRSVVCRLRGVRGRLRYITSRLRVVVYRLRGRLGYIGSRLRGVVGRGRHLVSVHLLEPRLGLKACSHHSGPGELTGGGGTGTRWILGHCRQRVLGRILANQVGRILDGRILGCGGAVLLILVVVDLGDHILVLLILLLGRGGASELGIVALLLLLPVVVLVIVFVLHGLQVRLRLRVLFFLGLILGWFRPILFGLRPLVCRGLQLGRRLCGHRGGDVRHLKPVLVELSRGGRHQQQLEH